MEFKGDNKLSLTRETIRQLIEDGLNDTMMLEQDGRLRVTDMDFGLYDAEIRVTFTTDPAQEDPPAAEPTEPEAPYGGTE